MTSGESVTTFAIRRNWKPGSTPGTIRDPEYAPVAELLERLNEYLAIAGCEPEEYGFRSLRDKYEEPGWRVPSNYRRLIAYAVEGGSEGYYCHVAAVVPQDERGAFELVDLGFCKVWDVDLAYRIAREAQRFLTAADWN